MCLALALWCRYVIWCACQYADIMFDFWVEDSLKMYKSFCSKRRIIDVEKIAPSWRFDRRSR